MIELASKFEYKLAKYAQDKPVVSQTGTVELFFDTEAKQSAFNNAIQDPNGAPYKVLLNAYNKSNGQAAASFNLKVKAEPGKGANWILDVQPANLRPTISAALDSVYQKVVGGTMAARLATANAGAKAGSGSGILDVGSLELAP